MPQPSDDMTDDVTDDEVEREEAPAEERADHAAGRVHLRPEAGESKEEFAARFLAAVVDQHRTSEPEG